MKYRGSEDGRANATTKFISEGFDSLGIERTAGHTNLTTEARLFRDRLGSSTEAGGIDGQDNGRPDSGSLQERARGISSRVRYLVKTALTVEKLALDSLKIPQLRLIG